MDEWNSFIEDVLSHLDHIDCDFPFFRGHNNSNWKLLPSLYRVESGFDNHIDLEDALTADFASYCGPIFNRELNPWEKLFTMRHSGLPTRLLDWTENFASALFFALKDVNWEKNAKKRKYKINPCIWILDPYKLNEASLLKPEIFLVDDLPFSFSDIKDKSKRKISKYVIGPIAIMSSREHQRIFAQKCVYTLHCITNDPIEMKNCDCVRKFDIPLNSIETAKKFLFLSGVNEYSLFPDMDGLGKYLKQRHFIRDIE